MTTQVSTPAHVTTYQDKVAAVASRFSVFGVTPSAMSDAVTADETITTKVQDLRDKFTPVTDDVLREAGTKAASGKGVSAITAALAAPVMDERWSVVESAATAEWTRRADRPEFRTADLIQDAADQSAAVLAEMATEAVESLEGLPAYAVEHLQVSRRRATTLLDLIDARRTPASDIDALRRAADVWGRFWNWAGSGSGRAGLDAAFKATASGSTSVHAEGSLAADHMGIWAVLLTSKGMAALASGYTPEQAVLAGHAEVAPLADPLGEDGETYRHRLVAATALDGLLEGGEDVVAASLRQMNPSLSSAGALRQSARNHTLLERVGLGTPSKALAWYLDQRPDLSTDAAA